MTIQLYRRFKAGAKVFFGKAEAVEYQEFSCPVCGKNSIPFYPLSMRFLKPLHDNLHIHPAFMGETMNFEHYLCSSCQASDRDRLYALYFKKVLSRVTGSFNVLDIAPAAPLSAFLKKQPALKVRTADLLMEGVDDKVDITKMDVYKNGQFDVFICSHVLEHIPDDVKAMHELHRILKPGGWGIAMVPINLGLTEVYENPEATTDEERWKHFGQNDHVRFYSKQGFVSRLQSAGFVVSQYGRDFFGADVFERHAIHSRSILYIVSK